MQDGAETRLDSQAALVEWWEQKVAESDECKMVSGEWAVDEERTTNVPSSFVVRRPSFVCIVPSSRVASRENVTEMSIVASRENVTIACWGSIALATHPVAV